MDWDLNGWSWDGHGFLANPTPQTAADGSPYMADLGMLNKRKGESDGDGRGKNKGNTLLLCQVETCLSDLASTKDYHRRHKVCEIHAKAAQALVAGVMQRFCQQCSRFHLLQEFDEGKRSCRRRLEGHNKRRRKTNPDASASGTAVTNERSTGYLLITLLKILSNFHSGGSDQLKDQDFLSHLLRNITNTVGSSDASNLCRLLQACQETQALENSAGAPLEAVNPLHSTNVAGSDFARTSNWSSKMTHVTGSQCSPVRHINSSVFIPVSGPSERQLVEDTLGVTVQAIPSAAVPAEHVQAIGTDALRPLPSVLPAKSSLDQVRRNTFDLNCTYFDPQDVLEGRDHMATDTTLESSSPYYPSVLVHNSNQSSPPQTNSDSTSAISLSNSNGVCQSRTDRIVFKLFGKDPNDLPLSIRGQVLDWLSKSPTDIESYIRPGCLILTVYLRLAESGWEELTRDLTSSLNRLAHIAGGDFWGVGWMFAIIQHRIALIYNGQVVLDPPLQLKGPDYSNILSIKPVAASLSAKVRFEVKGFNLIRTNVRLFCAFEGRYMVPETPELIDEETEVEYDGPQCCRFYCSLPNATGRGVIEVEDHGLQCGFFPFVVAEEDVCSDIRMLEGVIEDASWDDTLDEKSDAMYARNQAINFLHEMGWLLRTSSLRSRLEHMSSWPTLFPLTRFTWLVAFAMDRDWCSVVKKLLDILFQGIIESGGSSPTQLAQSQELLHRAVRNNCRLMVDLLLRYTPCTMTKGTGPKRWLFKPDTLSSTNLTPLHIAASISGAEAVLDALINDPGQLGIKAWSSVRDPTGYTPEDYARSRGFDSYTDLVDKKMKKKAEKDHSVVDVPGSKVIGFEMEQSKLRTRCRVCERGYGRRSVLYRPVMLSMVGIAAVCVCVGLLLKSPPEVLFIKAPFRWENLDFGSM